MSVRCIRCYVSGTVQGVFYRAGARARAVQLGLRGYVRNLPDGRVEVVACGDAVALDSLTAWLREGSPRSLVTDLLVEPATDPGVQEFDIH
ncbi:MAG: acylphosphatase [Nitrococcus sp.]|nr:acylphosphatase [Nitrococcus sp.]